MKKRLKKIVNWTLFAAIGILLVWWSLKDFSAEDKANIVQAMRNANYKWIALSLLMSILAHISRAMRWQQMIAPIATPPSLPNSFMAVMVGYLSNLALPRLGEFARCGVVARYSAVTTQQAIGTVITERAIDFLLLIIVITMTLFLEADVIGEYFNVHVMIPLKAKYALMFSGNNLLLYTALIVGGLLSLWLGRYLMRHFKQSRLWHHLVGIVLGMWQGIISVGKVRNLPLFLGHSLFIWIMYYVTTYVCFFSTEATQNLGYGAVLATLSMGSIGFIATQGGIGAYQLVVTAVLMLYSVEKEMAYAFSWLAWSAQTLVVLVLGGLSMILLPILNGKPVKIEENIDDL